MQSSWAGLPIKPHLSDPAAYGCGLLVACIVLTVGFAIWLTGWHVPPELGTLP